MRQNIWRSPLLDPVWLLVSPVTMTTIPGPSIRLVNVLRKEQEEGAFAGCRRAGKRAATDEFHRRGVREDGAVIERTQAIGKGAQLFTSADKLHGIRPGRFLCR